MANERVHIPLRDPNHLATGELGRDGANRLYYRYGDQVYCLVPRASGGGGGTGGNGDTINNYSMPPCDFPAQMYWVGPLETYTGAMRWVANYGDQTLTSVTARLASPPLDGTVRVRVRHNLTVLGTLECAPGIPVGGIDGLLYDPFTGGPLLVNVPVAANDQFTIDILDSGIGEDEPVASARDLQVTWGGSRTIGG